MLHPGFPQVAQAITTEKADCSLFNQREGSAWLLLWVRAPLPPPSQPLQMGVGRPWKTTG